MEYTDFIELGLNTNESKVYAALLRRGSTDAATLISDTKLHKGVVYDNLQKLADKGLATYIEEGGSRTYHAASADQLMAYLDEKEARLKEQRKKAEDLLTEIQEIRTKSPVQRKAEIFSGVKGIKTFYAETLKGPDYCAFGAPQACIDIMTPTYWRNHVQKRKAKGIVARFIFNSSAREYATSIVGKHTKIRFFREEFEPLTETHIQKEVVAFLVWTEDPIAFVIRDPVVASNYQEYFETLWEQARE